MPGELRDTRLGAGDVSLADLRIGVVAAGIVLVFSIFVLRLFQLQILEGADLRSRSERNSVRTVVLEAPRGDVLDREGRVLATTRPAYRVQVMPNELRAPRRTFRALGLLLDRDAGELRAMVGTPTGRGRFQPVVLAGDLGYDYLVQVESHRFGLAGVVTDIRPRRHYVEIQRAGHLLGSIGEIQPQQLDTTEFSDYRAGEIVGQVGLELRLESHLRGRAGGRNVVVDVAGREIEEIDEVEPVPGGRVVLTIDLDLQRAAEEAFASTDPEEPERMGALVALDPRNGEVLAMVSRPAYDPNAFAGGIDRETWLELMTDEWRPLQNRVLAGHYSPGSTYKTFVAAAALAEGEVDPEEKVYCPGYWRLGRRVYRCWDRGGHGDVNLRQALVHSCDVFFYQLGVKLGIDRLAKYATGFGLGRLTGIELPGEAAGLVPTREWKQRVKREPWIKGETVSVSIGQGANLATPLQLAVAYAAIGNGGILFQPQLVRRLESWDGELVEERAPIERGRVPIPPEALAQVTDALVGVVQDHRGTGGRARVSGLNVAGKTGTTQVVALEMFEDLEEEEIPRRFRDHALFAAFAPAEAPEIAIVVLVEHAGAGGGKVAAPVARKVLARWFEKKLEREPPPQPEAELRAASELESGVGAGLTVVARGQAPGGEPLEGGEADAAD